MATFESLTPAAAATTKIFVYAFRSAPTADLVAWGEQHLANGGSAAQLLDFLFNYNAPGTPYPSFANSSDATFVRQLIGNLSAGASVSLAKQEVWAADLLAMKQGYASRAEFAIAVATLVDTAVTSDPDLLAVRESLQQRLDQAAEFAATPAGATYNGQGFGQLQAPLLPPEPTYALSADVGTVDEGGTVVFTLQTTHVAAGTQLAYTINGTSINSADLAEGALAGNLTVGADGRATLSLRLATDLSTEGTETLRMNLTAQSLSVPVTVNDTSRTPTPTPTYQLSAAATADEGSELVVTLTTTNVAAGTTLTYTLSGTSISPDDLNGNNPLTGAFVVGADGTATARLNLRADTFTEGVETLRIALTAVPDEFIDVQIQDTSRTPDGNTTPDTVVIADAMQLSGLSTPATPLEGEIKFDSYLSYDLLNQGGQSPVRMTVAQLVASGEVAGAPLVTTNQSADRGNLPQVSNAGRLKLDLAGGTDRVDYSAETGRIVAVVPLAGAAGLQRVLVNDNGTDDNFANATDRIDELTAVEQIVASAGGGVLDLTASGRGWTLSFSDNFGSNDIDSATDRALHRLVLRDAQTGNAAPTQYLEQRDAGTSGALTVTPTAWSRIEGSDLAETLQFTAHQALTARSANLRGGDNTVSFSAMSTSVQSQVAITAFVASTLLSDDRNTTGVTTATTSFTDGHGSPLPGGQNNVASAYTPDNAVAAGSLRLVGSQDSEDAIGFQGSAGALHITLGRADGRAAARLLTQPGSGDAVTFNGYETLTDNGGSDDVYSVQNLTLALAGPRLVNGMGADDDTLQLFTEALGHAALGGANQVNLATLTGVAGFNYGFTTLDIAGVAGTALQVSGTVAAGETLVLGALSGISTITGFETVQLTDASLANGAALVLDLDMAELRGNGARLFGLNGQALSAEGSTRAMVLSVVDSSAGAGATLTGGTAADQLTGAMGNDIFRGGRGNDVLSGGTAEGSVSFQMAGLPDATTAGANRITLTLNIGATVLRLDEAAVADTAYGDGVGAVIDGASRNDIGNALVGLVQAHIGAQAVPLPSGLKGASYDSINNVLRLTFTEGSPTLGSVTLVLTPASDTGTLAVSAPTVVASSGGADRFVFEASGAANGTDTLQNFGTGDKLDVTAFTGVAITAGGAPIDSATGGTFSGGAGTAQFIYGRSASLTAADFATAAAAGKFVLADGGKAVVAVTADPSGALGDAANTPISLYFVDNGATAGLGDLSVSLVAVVSGPGELPFTDILTALG